MSDLAELLANNQKNLEIVREVLGSTIETTKGLVGITSELNREIAEIKERLSKLEAK